jgi:HAE1 family hydrophobic/amphiphilic exporter-1
MLTAALMLGAAHHAAAQQALTLEDAVARALARNHDIRIERDALDAADARALGALGEYDLRLRVDLEATHSKDPVTSLFSGAPAGTLAASHDGFLSSASVSQLFRSGAIATVFGAVERQSTNASYTLYDPAYITSLGVDVRQPLLRNRAIDPARASLRITALDRERSSAAFQRQVLETVAAVEKAYWELVAARRQAEIRRSGVTLAEQQREDTRARIHARTIAASDLAQPIAEVERRRGDVFGAQEQVARAERALKLLMLGDSSDPLWSIELRPAAAADPVVSVPDARVALEQAAVNRPELAEARASISDRDVRIELARDGLRPRLDVVGSYTARGLSGSENPNLLPIGPATPAIPPALDGGLPTSWNALVRNRFPDLTVGVTFEVPIGRRGARAAIAAAEAGKRQTVSALEQIEQHIAVEVRDALTALETAAARIQAARAGLEAAETQLQAEQDRYSAGATSNFFVLTRQTDLTAAQLTETAAVTDYRRAAIELARATGTLLHPTALGNARRGPRGGERGVRFAD